MEETSGEVAGRFVGSGVQDLCLGILKMGACVG
jgi:hypothetical protein